MAPVSSAAFIDRLRLIQLIQQAGLTHAELARRVGVKQPTITRLTTGEQGGSKHIHKIARELRTTPAYLTGETDDVAGDVTEVLLTSQEREMLDLMRAIPEKDRAAILHIARTIAHSFPPPGSEGN